MRTCTSFDFQPGSRIASFSGAAEYEESTCYLTHEQAHPEGIGNLVLVPNSVHFTEVCLSCAYIATKMLSIITRFNLKMIYSPVYRVLVGKPEGKMGG